MVRPPLEIGWVARAHGIRGDVLVRLHNEGSDLLTTDPTLLVGPEGGAQEYRVAAARPLNLGWAVRLVGVVDRTAAEALRGKRVAIAWEGLPALAPDEFYFEEIRGFTVVGADGCEVGRVLGVFATHVDNLVVERDGREIVIPAVPAFLRRVDRESGRVEVDLPEGFLEI